ncbi:MAG: sortase, partial [Streptococcaceae bacterium]|nr:sortase [Streptococcaceae bacterium]
TAAATFGGVPVLSVNDNKNTHVIAHNPGAFAVVKDLKKGDKIMVVDKNKKRKTYTVQLSLTIDDDGYEVGTKKDYWYQIIGVGKTERLTLQTCLSQTTNRVVFAY